MTLVIAHRGGGSGVRPENSLEAFRHAIVLDVDGIELDVHLWKDDLVVVHDDPTGGPIRPTFRDALEVIAPSGVLLYAEAKMVPRFYPGLVERMLTLLREHGMVKRTVFASFDHDAIVEAKQREPGIRTAALSSTPLHDPGKYVRSLGADIYAVGTQAIGLRSREGRLREDALRSCRANSVEVWVYTVNEPEDMNRLSDAGIDAIFTDYPERLQAVLKQPPRATPS